jgi:hypothetical protein
VHPQKHLSIEEMGVHPIFSFNGFKIPFVSLQGWGKTKGIFMKVQFGDTPKDGYIWRKAEKTNLHNSET